MITGDFSLSPPYILEDLQQSLIGLTVIENEIHTNLESFFEFRNVDLPGIEVKDITQMIIELNQIAGTVIETPGLSAAVERLVAESHNSGCLCVLLTDQPAPALCLANRHPSIRAALGGTVEMVREARQTLGVNLLVVNPADRNLAELTNTLREYVQGGPQECPAEYQNVLHPATNCQCAGRTT